MDQKEATATALALSLKENIGILSTITVEGYPYTCALIKLKQENLKTFYFSTNRNSSKVENIKKNHKGCIYFYDALAYTSASLAGTFEVLEPNDTIVPSEIFPEGLKNKEYVLICFHTEEIKVYQSLEKKTIYI